jgi:hypothetical protein
MGNQPCVGETKAKKVTDLGKGAGYPRSFTAKPEK